MFQRGLKISGDDSGHFNYTFHLTFSWILLFNTFFRIYSNNQKFFIRICNSYSKAHMLNSQIYICVIDTTVLCPLGNGPCLGSRKPGQPYRWISYTEVWYILVFCSILFSMSRSSVWSLTLHCVFMLHLQSFRWQPRHRYSVLGCWLKAASRTRSSLLGFLHRTDQRYKLTHHFSVVWNLFEL